MHILHLIKTSEGATWAINQIKEQKKVSPDITFSVIINGGGKHLNEYYKVCRNVYLFNFKLNHSFFSNGIKFRKIVLKDEPDIIHSWFTQPTLYARFFLRDIKIPRLFQVVGPAHLDNKLFRFLDIKSAQENDFWIATSKYIYNIYHTSGISENKLFFNYAYIDIPALLRSSQDKQPIDYKIKYSIPDNYFIVGTASYVYPPKFYQKDGIKGHNQLLEVFKLILKERQDVVLIIAGKTFGNNKKYENKLKKLANKIDSERIIFTGGYDNIYEVISNFDVFVYLSKSENLGGVFESLLFKKTTICSDRGGLPELVINGKTGYLVDLKNNQIIKDVLIKVLESDNSKINDAGRKRVTEILDQIKTISRSLDIYHTIYNSSNV